MLTMAIWGRCKNQQQLDVDLTCAKRNKTFFKKSAAKFSIVNFIIPVTRSRLAAFETFFHELRFLKRLGVSQVPPNSSAFVF